jgi:hypothetical protein
MILFSLGLISGAIAWWIGKWRSSCVFWSETGPWNLPLGWRKPSLRFGSLALVTILSGVFATCWALLIMTSVNKLIGGFSWGVLLMLRWIASNVSAHWEGNRILLQHQQEDALTTARPKRSLNELSGVSMFDMSPDELNDYLQLRTTQTKSVSNTVPGLPEDKPRQLSILPATKRIVPLTNIIGPDGIRRLRPAHDRIEDDPSFATALEAANAYAEQELSRLGIAPFGSQPLREKIKKQYLKEKLGIDWLTTEECNPGVIFN